MDFSDQPRMSYAPVGAPPRAARLPLGAVAVGFDSALRIDELLGGERLEEPDLLGLPLERAIGAADDAALRRAAMQALDGRVVTTTCTRVDHARELIVRLGPDPARPGSGNAVWFELSGGLGAGSERERSEELLMISEAIRELARALEPDEVRRTACEAAIALSSAEAAILLELDPETDQLRATAAVGIDATSIALPLQESSGAVMAMRTNTARLSPDTSSELEGARAVLAPTGLASVLWQPIARGRSVRAILAAGWRWRVDSVHPRSARMMEVIAVEAAVAIDRANAFDRLVAMVRRDPITGLANRRAWEEELGRELARAARARTELAIVAIELDDLDAYAEGGNPLVDQLLQTLARQWGPLIRATDTLAHFDSGEFGLLLPDCGPARAQALLQRLRAAGASGFCAGVASWDGSEGSETLMARADRALQEARSHGPQVTSTAR